MPFHANFCLDPKRVVIGIEDGNIRFGTMSIALPPHMPRMVPVVLAEYEPGTHAMLRKVIEELVATKRVPLLHLWGQGKYVHCALDFRMERPRMPFLEDLIHESGEELLRSETWDAFVCVSAVKVRSADADGFRDAIAQAGLCVLVVREQPSHGSASVLHLSPGDGAQQFVLRTIERNKPRMYD